MDAPAWDARYAATGLVWSATPNRFVAEALADAAPGRALDLACGEGRNARWLADRGWRVTAVDFSEVGVDKGRRWAPDVEWRVGDVLTAPLPGDLDLVLVAYLQLPAEQRRTTVRRAVEALAVGGRLFVVAHDRTNLAEGVGGPQDPAVLYSAEDVLGDLEGLAVTVDRAERVARVVSAADGHGPAGTAWDALVDLRRAG